MNTTPTKILSRPWLHKFLMGCLVPLLLSFEPAAFSQVTNTTSISGVDMTLSLNKTRIHVGEPVILNITMENVSGPPMVDMLANFQLSEGNNLEVLVQPPGELEYRYAGAFEPGIFPGIALNLMLNSPKSVDTLLLFDGTQPSGLLFGKPGTYEVWANFQFRLGGSVAVSSAKLPPVKIEVAPATGEDKAVLDVLQEPNYIRSLHLGIVPTTGSILTAVENVAERHPATSLGALATRALGHFYARGQGNQLEKGTQLLQNFIAEGQVPVELDGTAWNIMTAYHLGKKFDHAREWAFYIMRTYPESIRIRAEDALLYYYYYEPQQFASEIPWYLFKAPWVVPGVEPPTDLKPRKGAQ